MVLLKANMEFWNMLLREYYDIRIRRTRLQAIVNY